MGLFMYIDLSPQPLPKIYVGILMMGSVKNINWDDFKTSVPAFLTSAIMPFTYNISYGIAFGLISYIVISVLFPFFAVILKR